MERSKIGGCMYSFTMRVGKFLGRHMWIYYLLNYTWGIIMTFIGWAALLFCRMFLDKRIGRHGPACYVTIGDNWGGLELGKCFLVADNMGERWTEHTKNHEMGHSFQNAIYGPFAIFIVAIPSACRYWHQRIMRRRGKSFPSDWYDSAWFEGSATDMGDWYMNERD